MSNVITTIIYASSDVIESTLSDNQVDFNIIQPMPDFKGNTIEEQHWANTHWGVKANAKTIIVQDDRVVIQTDWVFPELWLNALSAKFPDREIIINYASENLEEYDGVVFFGGSIVDRYELEDGELAALDLYV